MLPCCEADSGSEVQATPRSLLSQGSSTSAYPEPDVSFHIHIEYSSLYCLKTKQEMFRFLQYRAIKWDGVA
jgi:hypothetical protein